MIFEVLWAVFFASAALQLVYLFIVFGRLAFFKFPPPASDAPEEGVSVVVASRNELKNIKQLLPLLASQHYPQFEIIIVNDRSTDGTAPFLRKMLNVYPQLRTVTVRFTPSHVTSKKYALTLGIKVAKFDIILLTDADCRPVSSKWISLMSHPLREDLRKKFVLGYGAYQELPGLLNGLIQYETLFTAISYFSWALWKAPFMGVGRNLAYRRSFFMEKNAFKGLWPINGGDDDLFVNRYAQRKNTSLVINPMSRTESEPQLNWRSFFVQKIRHFHAGKYYKTIDKFKLGIYAVSHLLFWILAFFLLFTSLQREPIIIILGLVVTRALVQTAVFRATKKKLEGEGKVSWMMLFDLPYLTYFCVIGSKGYLSRKIKWK